MFDTHYQKLKAPKGQQILETVGPIQYLQAQTCVSEYSTCIGVYHTDWINIKHGSHWQVSKKNINTDLWLDKMMQAIRTCRYLKLSAQAKICRCQAYGLTPISNTEFIQSLALSTLFCQISQFGCLFALIKRLERASTFVWVTSALSVKLHDKIKTCPRLFMLVVMYKF